MSNLSKLRFLKMRHTWPQLWVTTILFIATVLIQMAATTTNRFNPGMTDKKILDELFKDIRYDKRMRPEEGLTPGDGEAEPQVTKVDVNVVILSLSSPDESSLKYEAEFLLHQHWMDPRLAFSIDGHSYDYINGNHHHDKIWVPDTYFFKHGEFHKIDLPINKALRIYKNGTIVYTQRRRLSLSCEGDLAIFPFDDPKCTFTMESVSYEARELVYNWKEDNTIRPLHFLTNMHVLNAYIKHNHTSHCDERVVWRGNYSCLIVHMTFTRDKPFYFSTVFIPGMLLVTSAFITFWLEWNAVPGRVMLGVTTMLNFFTTSNNFRSNLPVVSNLTAMNVWDGVCMCFIYASLLEFVAVNYLGRKKPRALRLYRPASTTIAVRQNDKGEQVGNHDSFTCTSCPPNKCTHVDRISISPQDSQKVRFFELAHPLRVAKTIDVVSRVVFPVAYGVFLIFFFIKFNGIS